MKKLQVSFTGIDKSHHNLEADVKKIKTDQRKANETADNSAINEASEKMAEMAKSGAGIDPQFIIQQMNNMRMGMQ